MCMKGLLIKCGSPKMIGAVQKALNSLNISKERISKEDFDD